MRREEDHEEGEDPAGGAQRRSDAPVEKSKRFPRGLPRTTAFTGRVMKYATGGWIAFIEEVPDVSGRGKTVAEAEWSFRVAFARYVADERRKGCLCGEIQILWMDENSGDG